ncbi:hypothetical protein ONS95_007900 [Cadophora gregata]|uniref:uncharacterized protein n=1 Tax=Cadophora gregata TaxID=51156 RepID=UPI0026DC309D|nr:uncharacterized protein ONS95_007900 [Cadophora gregata]KAK0126289.1 hypothetical protein ONS95_007900 [Cadophora gregata]
MMDNNLQSLDPRLRDANANPNASASTYGHQQQAGSTLHTPLAPNPSRSPAAASPYQTSTTFNTPPSAGGNLGHSGGSGSQDGGNDANDPKRSRACEACRGLKVRCEPNFNNPDAPCKRCAKANRQCVITVPSRKRQKKTDSRVAELEKKINALTATLQAQGAGTAIATAVAAQSLDNGMQSQAPHNPYQQVTSGGYSTPYTQTRSEVRADEWQYPRAPEGDRKSSAPPMVVAGQKRKLDAHLGTSESSTPASTGIQKQAEVTGFFQTTNPEAQKSAPAHEYMDIIDRGLTTAETASVIFNHYVKNMAPHMPAVVFPEGTTAAEIRKTKPILFLAILSAGAGSLYPDLQRTLTKEVMSIYAERIICNGDKTIELIQALIISCLWYWPPEHFEELKFYQLIHIASVMAIDIGMNKKSKLQKTKGAGLFRDNPWRRTPFPDAESAESRRTWLACYFLCCNASMGLRRPNLIRWTSFMEDCIDFLETSPDALPSDKGFCHWIRSQHIAEDIGTQFSMDDPSATVNISDPKVQYALKGFEIELEKWASQIPQESNSPGLQVTEHVINLYMHEVAMHVDHNVEEFKPPFTDALLRDSAANAEQMTLTGAHIAALSICLKSIDGIFNNFLQFDVDVIRCLPVASFVRVAYAVVVLIKMYFAAATPGSHFGKVIDKDNMKVEQYLDGLVDLFRKSAKDEKSRPSAKFLMVLLMLKTWFHRQREEKGGTLNGASTAAPDMSSEAQAVPGSIPNGQRPQSSYSPSNTPLQLLSEVATGNSGAQTRSGSISNFTPSNEWQQMQFGGYGNMPQASMALGYGGLIDPNLVGMDFSNYAMGDGLEQAMGMTLGVGEFGNLFGGENNFFSGMMGDMGENIGQGFDGTI